MARVSTTQMHLPAQAREQPSGKRAACSDLPTCVLRSPASTGLFNCTQVRAEQSRAERCSFVPFREPNRRRCGVSIPCRSNLRCGKRFVLQQTRRHWQLEPKHGAAFGATARMRTFSDRASGSECIPANALHGLWPAPLMRQVYVKPIAEMQEATCFDARFTLPVHVPRSFPVSGGSFRLNMHDGARKDCLAALRSRDAPQSHSACWGSRLTCDIMLFSISNEAQDEMLAALTTLASICFSNGEFVESHEHAAKVVALTGRWVAQWSRVSIDRLCVCCSFANPQL